MRVLLVLLLCLLPACDGPERPDAVEVRLASLTPAGTSFVLAMGGGERLVAVSHYEADPAVAGLPQVGDYLSVDFETLAATGATHMIVQGSPDRLPAGLRERAGSLGVEVVAIEIDVLADAVIVMETLKPLMPDAAEAQAALDAWRGGIAEVGAVPRGPVRALVVTGTGDGVYVAGRGTYLDEMLGLAGGENAADVDGYASLDDEAARAAGAAVVLLLDPNADADADRLGALGRVERIADADALLPGYNTAALTAEFADRLHGDTP